MESDLDLAPIPVRPSARPENVAELRQAAQRLIAARRAAVTGESSADYDAAQSDLLWKLSPGLVQDWADELDALRAEVERLRAERDEARKVVASLAGSYGRQAASELESTNYLVRDGARLTAKLAAHYALAILGRDGAPGKDDTK